MKTKPMKDMVETQMWKTGDTVLSTITDFNITKGKTYTIVKRGVFYDCFVIVNDLGKEEEYSEDYFKLVVEE